MMFIPLPSFCISLNLRVSTCEVFTVTLMDRNMQIKLELKAKGCKFNCLGSTCDGCITNDSSLLKFAGE